MTKFEEQVIADLAELKTNMRSLIGNGQPGRIGILEKQVSRNTTHINYIIGGLLLISGAAGLIKVFL